MKLTDQNASGHLGNLLRKLSKSGTASPGGTTIARETKKTRAPKTERKKSKTNTDIETAVDALIEYQEKEEGNKTIRQFRLVMIEELKRGTFSETYWEKCTLSQEKTFYCVPSFSIFTGGRNYSYPDPAMLPSDVTYGEGVETTGNARVDGQVISGQFRETMYKWKRFVFDLKNPIAQDLKEPCFIKLTGPIIGTASEQACRALLSVVYKCWLVASGSTRLTTYEPPTDKPINDWYKYTTPRGVPPYWEASRVLDLSRTAVTRKYVESTGSIEKAVVLAAPAPLKGRRFNNNETVACEFQPTVEMWQLKKAAWKTGVCPLITQHKYHHKGIAWGLDKYVFLDVQALNGDCSAFTSTDGLSWSATAVSADISSTYPAAIIFAFGKFISGLAMNGEMPRIMYSTDGLSWLYREAWDIPERVDDFAFSGSLLLSSSSQSAYVWTSSNGLNWDQVYVPSTYGQGWGACAHNGNGFALIGRYRNEAAYSPDGVTFYQATMPSWAEWTLLAVLGTRFVAVAYASNKAAYSDDNGATWTPVTLPRSWEWVAMQSDGSRIILFTASQTSPYYTTTDGVDWTSKTAPAYSAVSNSICGNKFVVTTGQEVAISSSKGV